MSRLFSGTQWDREPRCPKCEQLEAECQCPPAAGPQPLAVPNRTQKLKLRVEKRKQGKVVTVIAGLSATKNKLPEVLKQLKNLCGSGGTLDGDNIELQGDHTAKLEAWWNQQR
jgi:translation initiation factor 1